MSIKAEFSNGVFKPIEQVPNATPGKICTVFSEEELRSLTEGLQWLRTAEQSFDFRDNREDAAYDSL